MSVLLSGEIFDASLRYVTHDDGTFLQSSGAVWDRAQELCETELRSRVRQSSGAVWDRAQELCETELRSCVRQSSGAVWKSRWTSWAQVPNKPTVSVDVKQHFNNNNNNNNVPRGLSDLQESDNRSLTSWHSSEKEVRSTVVWRPSSMQRHTSKLPKLMSEQTTSKKKSDEKDVPLVQFMYFVFTRMPGESYCRRLRSWLCLRDVFRALINSLVCWKSMSLTCPSWLRLTIRGSRVCRLQFWLGQQAKHSVEGHQKHVRARFPHTYKYTTNCHISSVWRISVRTEQIGQKLFKDMAYEKQIAHINQQVGKETKEGNIRRVRNNSRKEA